MLICNLYSTHQHITDKIPATITCQPQFVNQTGKYSWSWLHQGNKNENTTT